MLRVYFQIYKTHLCPKLPLAGYANHNHDKISELEVKVTKLSEQNALLWATLAEMVKDKPKLAEIRR